jgi:hypothetical protein
MFFQSLVNLDGEVTMPVKVTNLVISGRENGTLEGQCDQWNVSKSDPADSRLITFSAALT